MLQNAWTFCQSHYFKFAFLWVQIKQILIISSLACMDLYGSNLPLLCLHLRSVNLSFVKPASHFSCFVHWLCFSFTFSWPKCSKFRQTPSREHPKIFLGLTYIWVPTHLASDPNTSTENMYLRAARKFLSQCSFPYYGK